ncbi:MAG: hypothetical protein QOJ70_3701 [Acidobacteriota bacterium]|jgi:hypothetical protein|nr:hypothetical protein [Acidobacteriota bacterium]
MSLYIYCLGDELPESAFEGLSGVGGAAVRLLGLGRLSAVVSQSDDEPVAVTDENVLAHNRVNAVALKVSTPLPFRFGTRAPRERLAGYASANEAALLKGLARVRGCVEMSVKIMEKPEAINRKPEAGSEGASGQGDDVAPSESLGNVTGSGAVNVGGGRGTAFLMAKRREMLGEEGSRRRAEELATWLAAGVSGMVRETEARVNPSEAIVVRAAHLVERERVVAYRERLRSLGAERVGLRFLTSGPWPPYSFSDVGQ